MPTCPISFAVGLSVACTGALALAEPFPQPFNSEKEGTGPLEVKAAVQGIGLPPGFVATAFAAEPMVQNPIGLSFDHTGRLWVAENYTYAERTRRFETTLPDRVLILADTNADGVADERKVFADTLSPLTSVAVGHGGVWVMCPPQLLFIPDKDANDVPDGPPEVVLDGFTVAEQNYHNLANGLKWGPDGWLYGRCGASCPGDVGLPGTPAGQRVTMRGGMWRFNLASRVFEALTHGTTNPWGHDWDARGELFFVNTVNGHLWHGIPGAHFVRSHTADPHPFAYGQIDTHADHFHFDTGKGWQASRNGGAADLGGGHCHQGAVIYQGDNWPEMYRGKLLTANLHGRRLNTQLLERSGSGFVAKASPDFAQWSDTWFRGIDAATGPDGAVYVLDWSDTGECHDHTGVHRTSGRIYKIAYGVPKAAETKNLMLLSPQELAKLHTAGNDWFARQAWLRLHELAMEKRDVASAITLLREQLASAGTVEHKLRALWTLHCLHALPSEETAKLLAAPEEALRAWGIRCLTDTWPCDGTAGNRPAQPETTPDAAVLGKLTELATKDASGLVRLTLASVLQRLPLANRAPLAQALANRAEDAEDHNLPLMVWFGIARLPEHDAAGFLKIAETTHWPLLRKFCARRLAAAVESQPALLDQLLAKTVPSQHTEVLAGLTEAFAGWRKAPKPATWDTFAAALPPSDTLRDLQLIFGDGRQLETLRGQVVDAKLPLEARKSALKALVDANDKEASNLCRRVFSEKGINAVAVRGLAKENAPELGESMVQHFKNFAEADKPTLVGVMVSRPAWARRLLVAIATGKVPREALTAYHARQIRSLGDAELTAQLETTWGVARETPADKLALVKSLRDELTAEVLAKADKGAGRLLFNQLCSTCHVLYGEGRMLGPDLTGSGRADLGYLLDNIIDPGAVVTADFKLTTLTLKDGRVLAGLISQQTDRTVKLATLTEAFSLERSEIQHTEQTSFSLMPEGLVTPLSPAQRRDLFGYLMSPQQVPLPAGK